MWLKKMNFKVFILKDGISEVSKLKLRYHHNHKEENLDILNIDNLISSKNVTLFDIRSSQDYLKTRLKKSIWLNRSEIFKQSMHKNDKIIIITDDLKKAFLIVKDIQDQNKNCWIMVYKWSDDDLVKHPDFFDQTIKKLIKKKHIDFNFHTYKRHEGSKAHAEQYLKWETDLVDKMDEQELSFFNIF